MGDPNPKPFTLLPPGCRFFPSDEQLLCYYLTHKNTGDSSFPSDIIQEIDFYNYNPFDLPECTCFRFGRGGRKRHWYCYSNARVLKGSGRTRTAGSGYWRRKGPVRDVVAVGGKIVVGTRKCFVYYLGDSPKTAVKTDWVMYEYSLIDQKLASFVLCRVFVKAVCRNKVAEHALSSCGEESVATVRHVGGKENNFSRALTAHSYELKDMISGVPVGGQTRSPGHITDDSLLTDSLSAEELMAIRDEDYIELDDLVCPLQGID